MTHPTKQEESPSNLALQKGANVLWERQFKGTPWEGKVGLINPESMEEYRALALAVYRAVSEETAPASNPKLEGELREYARQLVSFQEENKRLRARIDAMLRGGDCK